MRRDNTPWGPIETAVVTWADNGTPRAAAFDDIYFSTENGAAETRHVFLQGNDLPHRWRHLSGADFRIVETGFGTGLNFLLTWLEWRNNRPSGNSRLHYIGIDRHPLNRGDLERALNRWPELAALVPQLLEEYPPPLPGQQRLVLDEGAVIVDLWWEDVADALADLARLAPGSIDAWFLDGFAPSRNPAMWQTAIFHHMAELSRDHATLATFTVAGHVRRGLAEAGFRMARRPGFGRKRECLSGVFAHHTAQQLRDTAWEIPRQQAPLPATALVIGAGLAGCSTAAALAARGVAVTVLEAGTVAGGASGNEQGVLYTRVPRRHSALSQFALQSFVFSSNHYRRLFRSGRLRQGRDGDLCGALQQCNSSDLAESAERLAALPELGGVVDAREAGLYLGVPQQAGGIWFPASGWLHPPALCRAWLDHPAITTLSETGPVTLQREGNCWHAIAGNERIASAGCAVIAAGENSSRILDIRWLTLQPVPGQTTALPATPQSRSLRAVLCHEGYICPPRDDRHCIGATFEPGRGLREPDAAGHLKNLTALARALPDWQRSLDTLDLATLQGRSALRCASPDYLPLTGPVPDEAAFLDDFASLRRNARREIPLRGEYIPGLFLNTGHGSRGLTSTPCSADLLAGMICGEPLPLSAELYRALNPARFLIRALRRSKL